MEENFPLKNCSKNDVLSFRSAICKVSQMRQALQKAFRFSVAKVLYDSLKSHGVEIDQGGRVMGEAFCRYNHRWFDEGVDCEILKLGATDWQKGKVKIKVMLEFCPDDAGFNDSPEDYNESRNGEIEWSMEEIYRMMNENSQ